jgi:DNA polymerase-1
MVLQVHDELLIEVQRDSLSAACDAVRREMEGVAALVVPLKVDLKWGPNWAELTNRP